MMENGRVETYISMDAFYASVCPGVAPMEPSLARTLAAITPMAIRIQVERFGPDSVYRKLSWHQYEIAEAEPAALDHHADDFLSPEQRVCAIADILAGIAVRVYKKGGHHSL